MIKKIERRMRCEVQGCHDYAYVGLGIRGMDYLLCEKHFKEMIEEGSELLGREVPKVVLEPDVKAEEPAEEAEEEYYVCKYCGEKFSKKEMTPQQFMAHSKKCKKEHEGK